MAGETKDYQHLDMTHPELDETVVDPADDTFNVLLELGQHDGVTSECIALGPEARVSTVRAARLPGVFVFAKALKHGPACAIDVLATFSVNLSPAPAQPVQL